MAQHKRDSDNQDDEEEAPKPVDPYFALVAAMLQRVIWDAQGRVGQGGGVRDFSRVQQEAKDFLADGALVTWWVELVGVDAETILPVLRGAQR